MLQVDRLQLSAQSYFGGFASTMRLAGYTAYREVGVLLEAAGEDLADFDICQHAHELLQRRLVALSPRSWKPGERVRPRRTELREFDEVELERAYVVIAARHPLRACRADALRALLGHGFSGSNDDLFQRALAAKDHREAFVLGEALRRRRDPRGLVLMAPAWADPEARGHFDKTVLRDLARKPGVRPAEGESFLSFWERVFGWEQLGEVCGDSVVTSLKDLVRRWPADELVAAHDRFLERLARSEDAETVRGALDAVNTSRSALPSWIGDLALHPAADVRRKAREVLASRPPADVAATFVASLERFPQDARSIVSQAAHGRFPGFPRVLARAAETGDSGARREIVVQLGRLDWPGATDLLVAMGTRETVRKTWWLIVDELKRRKAPERPRVLAGALGDKSLQHATRAACAILEDHGTSPERTAAEDLLVAVVRNRRAPTSLRKRAMGRLAASRSPHAAELVRAFPRLRLQ